MNRARIAAVVRSLEDVKRGKIYEAHEVREVLHRARMLEETLYRFHERIWNARRKAEEAFCEGWPNAKDAPWQIE